MEKEFTEEVYNFCVFCVFVLGGRGKDLSTPSRIKDADPRGHGRRHAYHERAILPEATGRCKRLD